MSFCGYAWDNPLGKLRLKFIAIDKHKSKEYLCEQAESLETEIHEDSVEYDSNDVATESEGEDDETAKKIKTSNHYVSSQVATIIKDAVPPHSMWTHSDNASEKRKTLKKRMNSPRSRSYNPRKIGSRKVLPCPSPKAKILGTSQSNLFVDVYVHSGKQASIYKTTVYCVLELLK